MEVEFASLSKELGIPAGTDDLTDAICQKNNEVGEMEAEWGREKEALLAQVEAVKAECSGLQDEIRTKKEQS